MSSGLLTRVARPAQYTSSRSVGSSVAAAEQYVSTSPVPTVSPAPRNSRAKPTSTSVNGTRSGTRGDLLQVVEVQFPQPVHGADNLPGQLLGGTGLADEHDLHLPVQTRIPDPVVQAATPER